MEIDMDVYTHGYEPEDEDLEPLTSAEAARSLLNSGRAYGRTVRPEVLQPSVTEPPSEP